MTSLLQCAFAGRLSGRLIQCISVMETKAKFRCPVRHIDEILPQDDRALQPPASLPRRPCWLFLRQVTV